MNTTTRSQLRFAERARHDRRSRRPLWILAGGAVAVVAALFAIFVAANGSDDSSEDDSMAGSYRFAVGEPGPGQRAPAIVLTSTAGGEFDLADSTGETVLLYFQEGVGCQPCWDQMRDIETDWDQFVAAGVDEFVTITSDSLDLITQKIEQDGIAGPVLADTDLAVSRTYDANSYGMMGDSADGHTFILVGTDGTIHWRADYGGSPDYTMYVPVPALLADMAAGTTP